jgi:hypothetical protein
MNLARAICASSAVCLVAASHAFSGTNLGFETGDFTGWSVLGYAGVYNSFNDGYTTVTPASGSYFAVVQNGYADLNTVASFAGVDPSVITAVQDTQGYGGSLYGGSAISTDVTFNNGDLYTELDRFFATDYEPYNDQAYVIFHGINVSQDVAFFLGSVYSVGSYGDSGWLGTGLGYGGPNGAEYQVTYAVFNAGDNNVPSYLGVDAPTNTTPSPAAILPFAAGLVGYIRRRSKK